jgi:hypothetical protein
LDKLNAETGRQLEHQGVSASLDRFTWHDLRRTAFTLLLRFGYSKDLAHAVTNHAEADKMAVVYGSAHRYEREKRMALWALGRYVQLILELDAYAAVWGSLRQHNDIEARDAAEDAFWLALRTGGTAWGDWLAAASGASSR